MTQEFVTLPREVVERALETLSNTGTQRGKQPSQFLAEGLSINALRAALDQPQNHVPEAGNMAPAGWKLVPVELTQAMIDQMRLGWSDISTAYIVDRWKRAVAAAPKPPTVKESLTVKRPQADQPAMTPIAQRKLEDLMASGYTISGYSVYHEQKHQHGFVTGAGLVGWWKPEGMEYPQPRGEQEPVARVVGTGHLGGHFGWCKPDSQDYLPPGALLYTHPQPRREPLTVEAKAVIDAARAAMDESTQSYNDRGDISIASELADALSLRLDEYDRAIEAAHNIK